MQETRSVGTPLTLLPTAMRKLCASGQLSNAERRNLAEALRYDAHSVALLAYEALNCPDSVLTKTEVAGGLFTLIGLIEASNAIFTDED